MSNKKISPILFVCLVFFFSCATPLYNQYKTAQQFERMGRETEALTIYKQLCRETKNEKYCSAYNNLRTKLASKFISDITNIISSYKNKYKYVPIPIFEKIEQEMSKLRDIARAQEVEMIEQEVLREKRLSEEKEKEILSRVKHLISEERYNKAFDLLNSNKFLHPERFGSELDRLTDLILTKLLPKGILLAKEERWHELRPIAELLYKVKPNDFNIKRLYKKSINNDSVDYYMQKAKMAKNIKDFDQALKYYKLATQYYPNEKEKIKPYLEELLLQLSAFYFESAKTQIEQGLLAQAYFLIKKAYKYLHELPLNKRSLIDPARYGMEEYCRKLYSKAKEFEAKEKYGISYFYYNMIFDLNPNYPNIKQDISRLENLIKDRAIKKLAVLTFKSPKSNPDAGTIITSSLIMKLQEYLKGDVKFIERETQPQLIKELEIKLMSGGTLKLAGIDLFVVGEVRAYKVETTEQKGKKTIMVKTGTKMLPNPEYERWLQQPDNIRRNSLPPDKYIKQPINRFISYNIKYIKKIGMVDVAYRIVDIQGKVIYTNSYKSKKVFNGEATEGVEVGDFKIPFKMPDLPSDSEIIELAQKEVIERIAKQIQELFIHSENKYLRQAESCKKRDDYIGTLENYANAIVIMKSKGLPVSKIKDKQIMLLDAIGI